ncbi:MAG: aminodeoxychorismate synthase component I [Acidobacteriota bacterium]|jgi:para-aminobenzoate synthetase component 1
MSSRHHEIGAAVHPAAGKHTVLELGYRPLWEIARALIGREPGVAFLDAGGSGEQARWSVLGWRPRRVVAWPQGKPGALAALHDCFGVRTNATEPVAAEPPFCGGWMGWFSYDLGRHIERLPSVAQADRSIPDFILGEYDMVLVEDRVAGRLCAAGRCRTSADEADIRDRAAQALACAEHATESAPCARDQDARVRDGDAAGQALPVALLDRAGYRRAIETILEHIRAGDIYQANFSHRFRTSTTTSSGAIYERLRGHSPAPFGCYLGLPGAPEILSASPELFLRKRGRRLQTRPIKGTRPRGTSPEHDARLLHELEASDKERAELLMITDLLRNDLGRVAEFGSVRVTRLRELESHPTVHHAYSVIEAELRAGLGVADLLAATLPGGSVTGAPKIRAMEILDRLEPLRRGPYTGAAGFIGDDGDLSLNILIRTLVRQGDEVWYQVGGGIVADSDPEAEYEETLAKGAALHRALTEI